MMTNTFFLGFIFCAQFGAIFASGSDESERESPVNSLYHVDSDLTEEGKKKTWFDDKYFLAGAPAQKERNSESRAELFALMRSRHRGAAFAAQPERPGAQSVEPRSLTGSSCYGPLGIASVVTAPVVNGPSQQSNSFGSGQLLGTETSPFAPGQEIELGQQHSVFGKRNSLVPCTKNKPLGFDTPIDEDLKLPACMVEGRESLQVSGTNSPIADQGERRELSRLMAPFNEEVFWLCGADQIDVVRAAILSARIQVVMEKHATQRLYSDDPHETIGRIGQDLVDRIAKEVRKGEIAIPIAQAVSEGNIDE